MCKKMYKAMITFSAKLVLISWQVSIQVFWHRCSAAPGTQVSSVIWPLNANYQLYSAVITKLLSANYTCITLRSGERERERGR